MEPGVGRSSEIIGLHDRESLRAQAVQIYRGEARYDIIRNMVESCK